MTLRALCFSLSSSELLRGSIEDLTGWSEPASLRARQREKMPVARIGLRVLEALQSAFARMVHRDHLVRKSVERRLEGHEFKSRLSRSSASLAAVAAQVPQALAAFGAAPAYALQRERTSRIRASVGVV